MKKNIYQNQNFIKPSRFLWQEVPKKVPEEKLRVDITNFPEKIDYGRFDRSLGEKIEKLDYEFVLKISEIRLSDLRKAYKENAHQNLRVINPMMFPHVFPEYAAVKPAEALKSDAAKNLYFTAETFVALEDFLRRKRRFEKRVKVKNLISELIKYCEEGKKRSSNYGEVFKKAAYVWAAEYLKKRSENSDDLLVKLGFRKEDKKDPDFERKLNEALESDPNKREKVLKEYEKGLEEEK